MRCLEYRILYLSSPCMHDKMATALGHPICQCYWMEGSTLEWNTSSRSPPLARDTSRHPCLRRWYWLPNSSCYGRGEVSHPAFPFPLMHIDLNLAWGNFLLTMILTPLGSLVRNKYILLSTLIQLLLNICTILDCDEWASTQIATQKKHAMLAVPQHDALFRQGSGSFGLHFTSLRSSGLPDDAHLADEEKYSSRI